MQNQPVHPINSIFIDQDLLTNADNGNNTFVFQFSRNITTTATSRMSVANFSVPYSWFNISAAYGNNIMGYVWTDSTYTLTNQSGVTATPGTVGGVASLFALPTVPSPVNLQVSTTIGVGNTTYIYELNLDSTGVTVLTPLDTLDPNGTLVISTGGYVEYRQTGSGTLSTLLFWNMVPKNPGYVFSFTIPDGYYDLPTLNAYLQFQMIQNGHYMIDQSGNYVYFLEILENQNAYRDQINSYLVPQTLPTGWQLGVALNGGPGITLGGSGYPYATPKLLLMDNNAGTGPAPTTLFRYFGLKENNQTSPPLYPYSEYFPKSPLPPAGYKVQSLLGDIAPNQFVVHSVCLTCNYIDNPLRTTQQHEVSTFVVTTQNITVPFGTDIANSNFFTTWIPLLGGQTISQMTFQLLDQEGDPIMLEDPDTNIELLITDLRYS